MVNFGRVREWLHGSNRDRGVPLFEKPAKALKSGVPWLEIIDSPYRRLYQRVLDFINNVKQEKLDRLVAVIVPELVEPHWYE